MNKPIRQHKGEPSRFAHHITRGMRKRLTMTHILLSPVVLTVAIALVLIWDLIFGQAFAATGSGGIMAWLGHNLAPVMFLSMVIFLLLGYPTAFTLAGVGLFYFLVGLYLGLFDARFFVSSNDRIFGVMKNEILLAIPYFTFMGLILERSGMAEDLLDTIGQLFGTIRGGIAYAVIFVGALLGATTGVVAASVIAMGLISLPIMLRYGYDRHLASGVITASGTLAQIVPPSLVLIIMADQLGRSVEDMYVAAIVPAILLPIAYALWVFVVSIFNRQAAPGLPRDAIAYRESNGARGLWSLLILVLISTAVAYFLAERYGTSFLNAMRDIAVDSLVGKDRVVVMLLIWMIFIFTIAVINWLYRRVTGKKFLSDMAEATAFVLVPPLLLIFLVLGTIIIGLATPTEGGAMGATGSVVLAAIKRLVTGDKRRFSYDLVRDALQHTARLSAFVIFILLGARVFSLTFFGVNGHVWVEELLLSVTGSQISFLLLISLIIFILGMFLDFFEIAFIAVPLLVPAAESLDIDLIWLGIVLSVNLQTSFLTPPFGFALFYFRSTAPREDYVDVNSGKKIKGVKTGEIYRGVLPFIGIQILMMLLVIFVPATVTHYKHAAIVIDEGIVNDQIDSFGQDLELDLNLDF